MLPVTLDRLQDAIGRFRAYWAEIAEYRVEVAKDPGRHRIPKYDVTRIGLDLFRVTPWGIAKSE